MHRLASTFGGPASCGLPPPCGFEPDLATESFCKYSTFQKRPALGWNSGTRWTSRAAFFEALKDHCDEKVKDDEAHKDGVPPTLCRDRKNMSMDIVGGPRDEVDVG